MAMNGSSGTYQPTTSGSGNVSTSNINGISVPSGATGNYSNSIGSILATFSYNLLSHQITVS